jgi:hypothetical protein
MVLIHLCLFPLEFILDRYSLESLQAKGSRRHLRKGPGSHDAHIELERRKARNVSYSARTSNSTHCVQLLGVFHPTEALVTSLYIPTLDAAVQLKTALHSHVHLNKRNSG